LRLPPNAQKYLLCGGHSWGLGVNNGKLLLRHVKCFIACARAPWLIAQTDGAFPCRANNTFASFGPLHPRHPSAVLRPAVRCPPLFIDKKIVAARLGGLLK